LKWVRENNKAKRGKDKCLLMPARVFVWLKFNTPFNQFLHRNPDPLMPVCRAALSCRCPSFSILSFAFAGVENPAENERVIILSGKQKRGCCPGPHSRTSLVVVIHILHLGARILASHSSF